MKKVKLNTIVSIANIISSLTLIISIFILIREYRQSEVINEKTIENLVYDRMMELDRLVIENPDLAEILSKVTVSSDSLSDSDKIRYLAYEHIFYDSWETLWVGYQNGVVKESTWADWNEWFIAEYKKKPQYSWKGNLDHFSGSFLEYLNSNFIDVKILDSTKNKN